jgi:hypothetical protein
MSKSKNPKPEGTAGAAAPQSKSVLKTLDFDHSFIDVLKSDEELQLTCEAGESIKPGVERSGTPG